MEKRGDQHAAASSQQVVRAWIWRTDRVKLTCSPDNFCDPIGRYYLVSKNDQRDYSPIHKWMYLCSPACLSFKGGGSCCESKRLCFVKMAQIYDCLSWECILATKSRWTGTCAPRCGSFAFHVTSLKSFSAAYVDECVHVASAFNDLIPQRNYLATDHLSHNHDNKRLRALQA